MNESSTRPGRSADVTTLTIDDGIRSRHDDRVAVEEPLEIRLVAGKERRSLVLTMRTPGHDFELTAGFLFNEGIVRSRDEIAGISYCLDGDIDRTQHYNIVNVELRARSLPDLSAYTRLFTGYGACGICGRESIDALEARGLDAIDDPATIAPETLYGLPERMRSAQPVFERTGGLHATALFSAEGELLVLREDIGRHNAFDKIVGEAFLAGKLPLTGRIALVSGRASFELVQKAIAARIPILASISAPSSLAVDLAERFGLTLIGFLRGRRANVYAAQERIG
ncbi:MAG: formate dehydrogenase accessory sulfurtransferase FdhD [Candidatus Baltobacteraceae bacterium]